MLEDIEVEYTEPTPKEVDFKRFRLCTDALDVFSIKRRSVAGAMISAKSVARELDIDGIDDAMYMVSGMYAPCNTLTEARNAFQNVVGTIVGLDIKRLNEEADQDYIATIKSVANGSGLPAGFAQLKLEQRFWDKQYKPAVDEQMQDAYSESCQVKSGYDDVEDEVYETWPADSKGSKVGKEVVNDVDSDHELQYDESMSEVNHSTPNPNETARRNIMKTTAAKTVAKKTAAVAKTAKAVEAKVPSNLALAHNMVFANFREANKKRGGKPMSRGECIAHIETELGISAACAATYYHSGTKKYEEEVGARPELPRKQRSDAAAE